MAEEPIKSFLKPLKSNSSFRNKKEFDNPTLPFEIPYSKTPNQPKAMFPNIKFPDQKSFINSELKSRRTSISLVHEAVR